MDSAAAALGAESDSAAIGRKRRLVIVSFVPGQPDGLTSVHLLYPDIQVAFAAPVGSIRHQFAIRRDGRIGSEAAVRGKLREHRTTRFRRRAPSDPEAQSRGQ